MRISKDRLEQLMARRKRKSTSAIAAGWEEKVRLLLRRGRREAKSDVKSG